jgi:hypothetical protein
MASGLGPSASGIPQQMTVRFRGRIPSGHRLKPLGLDYDSKIKEWRGTAVREAVEEEIASFRHLLISIEVAAAGADGEVAAMPFQGGVGLDAAAESELPEGFKVELEN